MIYIIPGEPQALKRPRMLYNRSVFDIQKNEKLVHGIHLQHQHNDRPLFEGPLHMDVTFYLKTPQASRSKKPDRANHYHFFRPDLDNLLKFIFEIGTSVIYKDDCQISSVTTRKLYHQNPRTEFTLTPLDKDKAYENPKT